jgi:O-antigen/teichoic acid export membrane protein
MATTTHPRPVLHGALRTGLATQPLSLKRNAFWTTLGNGTYAAAQWLQIALIAHLGTTADVGHYALAVALSAPVFMFFNLQLRPIQATDSIQRHSFGEYLGLRLVSSACALMVVASLAFATGATVQAIVLTILVGLFKTVESVSDIYQGLLQQCERMDYVGRSLVLKSALILGSFAGVYYATHSLLCGVAAMLAAQLAGALLYDIRASYRTVHGVSNSWRNVLHTMLRAEWDRNKLVSLTVRAFPLGLAMMLISLYSNLPRFVLNKYTGASGVGIFAAITYLPMIGSLLMTAIGTAVSPRLSQYALRNHAAYRTLLSRLAGGAALLGLFGIAASCLCGGFLLKHMYGPAYAANANVLVWVMISGALSYIGSAFGFGATALGRFKGQPWIVAIATVVLLSSSLVLVPARGLEGAAMSLALSSVISLAGFAGLVIWKRHER